MSVQDLGASSFFQTTFSYEWILAIQHFCSLLLKETNFLRLGKQEINRFYMNLVTFLILNNLPQLMRKRG